MNAADLLAICPRLGANANHWIDPLNSAMETAQINTPARVAAFIANAADESAEFTALEENLNYGGDALLRVFPSHFTPADVGSFVRQPQRIANRVYANRMGNSHESSGDGWRYRGRGLFQITGKDNYRVASIALVGDADTLLTNPELLADPDYACLGAAWFWRDHMAKVGDEVLTLNQCADAGHFDPICDVINIGHVTARVGDSNGYPARLTYYNRALEVLGA